jgi:hypothetical protein
MIDAKYFAGFVDADGSIGLHIQKRNDDRYGLYPKVQIGQLTYRDFNLKEIASKYEVSLTYKPDAEMSLVNLCGTKAQRFIEMIKEHLVIKDELAEYVLSLPKEVSGEELKAIKKVVKSLRKKHYPTKNHPSRKWLAGYIDGDGCIYGLVKKTGVLCCKLVVASSADAQAGLRLIQKALGGNIGVKGNSSHYELHLGVSKVQELYHFCGKHLRIKKTQMQITYDYIGQNKHSKSHGATYDTNKKFCETLATTKRIGR